jgi:organic hydroperoxide reductase OsmC/OhrA
MPVIPDKILYRAHATATGGREGRARSSDGALEVALSTPREMGGPAVPAPIPSSCSPPAFRVLPRRDEGRRRPPEDRAAGRRLDRGVVGFGPIPQGYGIQVELKVSLPGMDRAKAEELVHAAHQVCPYSNATRGNVDVTLTVV